MAALARHPAVERHDLSALELIVSGGAPLGAGLQRAVAARFPHAAVGQGYGMTETAVAISGPTRADGTPPGSVGHAMTGTELRIVGGELWVRGPQVMLGYKDRPEETAAILDADGWLRTGDLVRRGAGGELYVIDRCKELIKVDAHQVAPAELEALLLTHPGVADAAVVGRPDARHGEVPVAAVVAAGALDRAELVAWVAERVAPYKRLHGVVAVDEIPRTPAGKVLRRIVSDRIGRNALGSPN
jgi:acyl-CoA synthetase (AMP-forming)/AMP-acid ligase II